MLKILLVLSLLFISCTHKPCRGSYTSSCKEGDGEACYKLGLTIFSTIDLAQDKLEKRKAFEKSSEWFKKGCDLGHLKSCRVFDEVSKKIN